MSNEELLNLMTQVGIHISDRDAGIAYFNDVSEDQMLDLAALVQRATAEDCAKVCDDRSRCCVTTGYKMLLQDAAEDIRTKYLQPIEQRV